MIFNHFVQSIAWVRCEFGRLKDEYNTDLWKDGRESTGSFAFLSFSESVPAAPFNQSPLYLHLKYTDFLTMSSFSFGLQWEDDVEGAEA